MRLQDSCQWEYYLEQWSLEHPPKPGTLSKEWPKRLWRERLTGAPRQLSASYGCVTRTGTDTGPGVGGTTGAF